MTSRNPISCTVPFDKDGEHHGFLSLPASREDSAWGIIQIPISVVRNGAGPTALLTGGNHGDEYEGPVALQALSTSLRATDILGRVIIVPFMNYPAFRAARRISPLDNLNMNRIFPGKPDGTPTQKIADYFVRTLIPMSDIVLDFHSGGKSLDFVPFAAAHLLDDKIQQDACVAAMEAFGAPYTMTLKELDATGMYDTAVENSGKIFVSTELGGGGTATAASIDIARRGARNILAHAGILQDTVLTSQSVALDTNIGDCFHFAPVEGLLEPCVDLGATVQTGDELARIWPVSRSGQQPEVVVSKNQGLLAARHFPGLVSNGDCLAVVATVLDAA